MLDTVAIPQFERQRRLWLFLGLIPAVGGLLFIPWENSIFLTIDRPAKAASAFAAQASTPPQPGGTQSIVSRALGGGLHRAFGRRVGAIGTTPDNALPATGPTLLAAGGDQPNPGAPGTSDALGADGGATTPSSASGSGNTIPASNAPISGGPGNIIGSNGSGDGTGGGTSGGGTDPGNGGTNPTPGAVPEPETWALMVAGLAAIGFARRRRRAKIVAA